MHKVVPYNQMDRIAYPVIPAFIVAGTRDRVGGMLAAWWTQLSFKPFLIGVSIAPERYTYRLLCEVDRFSINILDFKYIDATPYIGDISERFMRNKITEAGFTIKWSEEYNTPYVGEARAYMFLRLLDRRPYGDHDLFVGEVLKAYADEAFEDGFWNLSKYRPIMYLGRTRRPAVVKRVYVSFKEAIKREVEFAAGPLRKYYELRYGVLNELRRLVRKYGDLDSPEFRDEVINIIRKYGLDDEDAKYYIEELRRNL